MHAEPLLTVVLAAYNERDSFQSTSREILDALAARGIDAEFLVVDDGSTDGTGTLADSLALQDSRVRVVHHAPNLGLGGVYRTGFTGARGRYITFFPADGQFPADIIASFLPHMSDYDLVLGVLPQRDGSPVSKALSYCERRFYAVLVGPMPTFQGILMFRRDLLGHFELQSTGRGWAVLLEFILRCARDGRRWINVPTAVRPRAHGTSKVNNGRTVWSNFRQIMALRRILRVDPKSAT